VNSSITTAAPTITPRKKRRIFLWVFLAVQILFIILLVVGLSSKSTNTGAQAASLCNHGQWTPLYTSYSQCVSQGGKLLAAASDTGTAIGVGLIVGLWVAADVILGIGYGIYRLAKRP